MDNQAEVTQTPTQQHVNPKEEHGEPGEELEEELPPTKIQRKYYCKSCTYITTNPRLHLTHLQDVHQQKVKIVKCPFCVYACQYRQKLSRHLRLIHKDLPQSQESLDVDINDNELNNDSINIESSIGNINDFFADSQQLSFQSAPSQPVGIENLQMQQPTSSQLLAAAGLDYHEPGQIQDEPLNLSYPNELKQLVGFITQAFQRELEHFIMINYANLPQ